MHNKYKQSPQWKHINENQLAKEAIANLENFKSESINYKLAFWDPRLNGVRYLKTLIYNLAAGLSEGNWSVLRRIQHRELGNPISVRYDGESVCMDYLLAVYELEFITEKVDPAGSRILEIGAGYGRTCHAILSNHDVASYCIVDLVNALELAREYLGRVLEADQFAKITFVAAEEVDDVLGEAEFDLCINVNSLAEMNSETIRNYLDLIDEKCGHFYVKNPVGKYLDKSLDGHSQGVDVVAMALSTGPLLDIIDIMDNQSVAAQRGEYINAYRPAERWVPVADGWAFPWSYYWQVVYERGPRPPIENTP